MMAKLRRVVPAILADSPHALETMVRRAEGFAGWVQIDIMDGVFVPSRSVTSEDIASLAPGFDWEAHLMVREPEKLIEGFHLAGATKIIVHYEAVKVLPGDIVEHITSLGMAAGMAINPETPVSVLRDDLVSKLDGILFLSVHPGFYGAKFLPEVLDKIKEFRRLYPDVAIGIDGGIKEGNIARVAEAGVDEICVGSAIFVQPNPSESYKRLQKLAREGWQQTDSGPLLP